MNYDDIGFAADVMADAAIDALRSDPSIGNTYYFYIDQDDLARYIGDQIVANYPDGPL